MAEIIMAEILSFVVFVACFTAPCFLITICQWLYAKKVGNVKLKTACENVFGLFFGVGLTILLTVMGLELYHKVYITLHSCGIL